jgi:hypothetical protein
MEMILLNVLRWKAFAKIFILGVDRDVGGASMDAEMMIIRSNSSTNTCLMRVKQSLVEFSGDCGIDGFDRGRDSLIGAVGMEGDQFL